MTEDHDAGASGGRLARVLDGIERVGNRLPDPALLFFLLLLVVWALSAFMAQFSYDHVDPRTGEAITVVNLLTPDSLTSFLGGMVNTFVTFHPLGVVLLAMLGIGVADHTGFIRAALRALLSVTSPKLLTPMLLLIAIISHSAVDAGYVLVIPLGAVIFQAAGRHPLTGIAVAFAGVSGGFSANFVPSALDPMLQGISQVGARLIDPEIILNPLNNWFFTSASTLLIVGLGWYVTDRLVEPRLSGVAVDGDLADAPALEHLSPEERRGLRAGLAAMGLGILALVITAWPEGSAWRAPDGELAASAAPLMRSIVPLIFLFFLIPGVVYGYVAGSAKTHRDIVAGMTEAMSGMGYYVVMAFFASLFIAEFGRSNLGALFALQGAAWLEAAAMPGAVTMVGIVVITGIVNLFVGSASAKWALLAPILVPMLMQLGISPDLTQAAYRVGDSSTNIITPLMPYFPLVVVFCQRYVRDTGIGTVVAMMLPYAVSFLVVWTAFLLLYWTLGLPLGLQASYTYPAPG
ncbi:MAG: aminobenzoyl-glutamate transporter [Gammaproteobacteria bacterium]|nr:aminobenzoyl-glutamate transporter [Gammaproteobacteria bacterium]|tara:strand:- start:3640 stop:5196 length:1557 start_codon:yes stop_codon:yes gene_type:complete